MKIVITSPVVHDGKELEAGKSVDLSTDVAEGLIAVGAAEAAPVKAKAQAAEPTPEA